MSKVYSPSQTENFLQCPYYWALRKQARVTPGTLGPKELAGTLGTAFAAGVGAYNTARKAGVDIGKPEIVGYGEIAAIMATDALKGCDEIGHRTMPNLTDYRAKIPQRACKAVMQYAMNDPIPRTWERRDVELTLEEAGWCRPDLGCIAPLGATVIDYKTKVQLEYPRAAALDQRAAVAAAEHQWREQRFHYSWFYGRRVAQPVYAFQICVVVLEPTFSATLHPFVNIPSVLERWYLSRLQTWERMEACEQIPLDAQEMAASHETKFGPCDALKWCFLHQQDLNNATLSGDYVVQPPRERA